MESAVKSAFRVPVKQLFSCISADLRDKDFQTQGGFTKGPGEHHNPKAQEEKGERDAFYVQKKAERAAMRAQLRKKYRLPENKADMQQLRAAGTKVPAGRALAALVRPFAGLADLDLGSWKNGGESPVQAPRPCRQRPLACPRLAAEAAPARGQGPGAWGRRACPGPQGTGSSARTRCDQAPGRLGSVPCAGP